ncbi:MAG: AAA family ATPase [Betaproteobacteria bacterium]|nr:AAA family ATPase [Betaproteobacteria bacterium]
MTYPYYSRDLTLAGATASTGPYDPAGYRPDAGLVDAVNVALLLNRPLLLTGEPGTGKTQLAYSVAWQLAARKLLHVATPSVEKFETKSSSMARDLFYLFDTLRMFQAAQLRGSVNSLDYLTYNALGCAILNALPRDRLDGIVPPEFRYTGPTRSVVLIDEVDKAPRDFPNDLLNEIEHMYFRVPELGNLHVGGDDIPDDLRPIVIITSNSERNLPDPFLRRCIYYDIPFPEDEELREILLLRVPRLQGTASPLMADATAFFLRVRNENLARRRISPAELIQWLQFILSRGADPGAPLRAAGEAAVEGLGALVKDPADQPGLLAELRSFVAGR